MPTYTPPKKGGLPPGVSLQDLNRPVVNLNPTTIGKPPQPYAPPTAPVAPPPPPTPQPLPYDPQYEATVLGANKQYDLNQQNNLYQQGQIKQEYGFDDPSNPFSRARMLEKSFQQGQARTTNTAGNNLYSSSLQNNLNEGRYSYEQQSDAARRAYQDALYQLTAQGQQSTLDRDTALTQAQADRIYKAQQNPPEDPAPGGAQGAGPPGSPTNNTATQFLGPKGAISAKGLGGGRWSVTFSDNRVETIKIDQGRAYVLKNGSWKLWF